MSGFVQVRRDALRVLPAPGGRRTGAHLATLVVALLVVLESDWRTGAMDPWPMVAWGRRMSMPWRRVRRAVGELAALGHVELSCARFRPSSIEIDRSRWIHCRDRRTERFVQLSPQAAREVALEHELDWKALGVLLALVILADDRDWSVRGVTLGGLSADLGIGYRSLKAALDRLATAGLLSFLARPGRSCLVTVTVGSALVVGPAGPPMRRGDRRRLGRQTRRQEGPVWDAAHRIVDRFGIGLPPSSGFIQAMEEAGTRLDVIDVEHRILAMGSLAQARDPMAVLTGRARRISEDMDRRRQEDSRRRARQEQERTVDAERRAQGQNEWERQMGEDRWLARVLDDEQIRAFLEDHRQFASAVTPMPAVAAAIRVAARRAVVAHPMEDPEIAVRSMRIDDGVPVGGAYADADHDGPDVLLPTIRDGPTLTQRLRALAS
ncbi:MAG: hypothetical protein KGQ66_22300 [Acidobacteriota bacterium]|nr:hypothetical protein [Acidobacteriota bacterium]